MNNLAYIKSLRMDRHTEVFYWELFGFQLHGGQIPFFMDLGHVADQALGVSGLGVQDDLVRLAVLHELAVLHDVHGVGNVVGQADVMGDEDDGHADLVPELEQHIQDGGPGAGVHHGGWLVGQQDLGLQQEDTGDHQPLHLAAGKLEGILVGQLRELQVDEGAGLGHHFDLLLHGQILAAAMTVGGAFFATPLLYTFRPLRYYSSFAAYYSLTY